MLLTDNQGELIATISEQRHVIQTKDFVIKGLFLEIERLKAENSELKTKQDVKQWHLENSLKNVQEIKEIMNFKKVGV